jgi:amidase
MTLHQELADFSATEMRRYIGSGELSPVEVVEACLERVERYNGVINAVVTLSERAVDDAKALEQTASTRRELGLLHGLPVGIKDVTPVAGLRTTFGSPLYADFVPGEDALVVSRLREAGAVILGKTNCPEFGLGGNTFNDVFGCTRNPWNPARSAGGSTGGGAAGLATGMITLAEGTDLGGSLRIPASFCGVVGLRPSPGLVPTYPSDHLWDNLQVTGPVARTAEDVALMLQAMSGPTVRSPVSQPVEGRDFTAAVADGVPKGLRLAYCPDIAGIGIDSDVERVCQLAASSLTDTGAQVDVTELDLAYGREAFVALRGLWLVAHQYLRLDQMDRLGANVAANVKAGLQVTTEQLGGAEHARGRMRQELLGLFRKFDFLLTPTMALPPFPVEQSYPETVAGKVMDTYVDWFAPTFVLSLTGLPVASVPCGLDSAVASVPCGLDSAGLPVGLQIVGRPFGEEAVLALAKQVQDMHGVGLPSLGELEGWTR